MRRREQDKPGPYRLPLGVTDADEKSGVPLLIRLGVLDRAKTWEEFGRGKPATRAHVASAFSRLLSASDRHGFSFRMNVSNAKQIGYVDVPKRLWAFDAIQTVTSYGLFRSSSDYFHPDEPVTNLELARWLYALLLPVHRDVPVKPFNSRHLNEADRTAIASVMHWSYG